MMSPSTVELLRSSEPTNVPADARFRAGTQVSTARAGATRDELVRNRCKELPSPPGFEPENLRLVRKRMTGAFDYVGSGSVGPVSGASDRRARAPILETGGISPSTRTCPIASTGEALHSGHARGPTRDGP